MWCTCIVWKNRISCQLYRKVTHNKLKNHSWAIYILCQPLKVLIISWCKHLPTHTSSNYIHNLLSNIIWNINYFFLWKLFSSIIIRGHFIGQVLCQTDNKDIYVKAIIWKIEIQLQKTTKMAGKRKSLVIM